MSTYWFAAVEVERSFDYCDDWCDFDCEFSTHETGVWTVAGFLPRAGPFEIGTQDEAEALAEYLNELEDLPTNAKP